MRSGRFTCPTILGVILISFVAHTASAAALKVTLDYSSAGAGAPNTMPVDYNGVTHLGTTGGPFFAHVNNGPIGTNPTGSSFVTFCLEVNEEFSPGSSYTAVVSSVTKHGTGSVLDQNGTNGYVALQAGAAYLYSNYMAGTMSSVMALAGAGTWGGNSDQASVQSLQNAIWYYMGYQNHANEVLNGTGAGGLLNATGANHTINSMAGYIVGSNNYLSSYVNGSTYLTGLLEKAADAATGTGGSWGSGTGHVGVMQMWSGTAVAQDQLVMLPTPTASMAGLSLLGGLGLVGWIKRRRNVLD